MAGLIDVCRRGFEDLVSVLFPRTCEVCGTPLVGDERVICAHCDYDMPRTGWHRSDFSQIHQRVMGHAMIDRGAAMFHYAGTGRYADILRNAKYRGRPRLMRDMAARFAAELQSEGFFDGIDIIEAVPMAAIKRVVRGYNQTEYIAQGLSAVTGIPVGDHLGARMRHPQAGSRAAARRVNVSGKYYLRHSDELRGRHILLVDDIITTGSTLHEIAELLHAALDPDYRLSILTLAATVRG